jgi:hypothetical protein
VEVARVLDRPSPRTVGALSAGLVLGLVAGVLAGLLRAPKRPAGAAR